MAGRVQRNFVKNAASHSTPEAQCEGKRRYDSVGDVARALRRPGHKAHPYRCPYCQGWHVSTTMTYRTRRKRSNK